MKKRKQYLLDRKFQINLLCKVLTLIIVAIIISGVSAYLISVNLENKSKVQLYAKASVLESETYQISRAGVVKPVIIKAIAISGLLSIIMSFLAVFIYSHRFAGPVYHLNQHIKKMIEGNFDNELKFRKKDEFKQLADSINELQEKLKTRGPS